MLKQRIITAIILSLIAIASIFYLPAIGFRILALLIAAIGFWEFWMLFSNRINMAVVYLLGFILICIFTLIFIPVNLTLSMGAFWWIIVPYFLWAYSTGKNIPKLEKLELLRYLLGIVIFVPFFIGLITLKEKFGPSALIYFIAIVCSADIGAYFAGRFLGKKLLAAKISPKKTIEGVIGGLVLALIVASVGGFRPILLLLVIAVCLWSVIGDLFESMLKRIAGVKDSGKILPGHGGIYDRIDSLTAAVPIFALIIQYT